MKEQKYTSARTCLKHMPVLYKRVASMRLWKKNTTNLDIGGGKYDIVTEYLKGKGVSNLVYDPYNRTAMHNYFVRCRAAKGVDTATLSCVLNVIKEKNSRAEALRMAWVHLKCGCYVFISVYPGNGTGKGRQTNGGTCWQNNRKIKGYLKEIRVFFPDAIIRNGIIVGTKGVLNIK